jgi:hypothetical protein
MRTTRSLCLSLELDLEGERVTGWLADEQGNDWAFSCWLDLLSLIDRALAGTGSPAATTTARDRREVKRAPAPVTSPRYRRVMTPKSSETSRV